MSELDSWKLCCALTPVQASALIAGVSPARVSARGYVYHERTYQLDDCDDPAIAERFSAALHGISSALKTEKLYGSLLPVGPDQFDLGTTLIDVDDIRRWLASQGVSSAFFGDQRRTEPEYLNPEHPHYAPKLAAAIRAWEAVTTQPQRLRAKTPKQALQSWLIENAAELGLLKSDGAMNQLGIEEVSKLANWKPEGGASKTPAK